LQTYFPLSAVRKAFGAPLISQQLLRHRMAKMKTEIVVGRSFLDSCLLLHSEGRLVSSFLFFSFPLLSSFFSQDTATASMAKAHASDMQGRVADECVQLHGGNGFMWEYAVTRHFADARVNRIYGGTNEVSKCVFCNCLSLTLIAD
jgi:long-chain-acyl-CoA dehydrogenase